ncbi:hypothetical protein [Leptolyngbya sp. GGD]|uniref:hypothetical protein n=1 Tax=Leptolyngbya sp. GGD TaxID=2997907 RepID=UPI00227B063D|nr:hypothetical protein [Leptolyngbya sp. GGD]MCY6493853.1 hypothetical protein [Leptolyngbya sp. GGD]
MNRLFTTLLMATAIALPVSASANQPTASSSQTIAQAKASKSVVQSRLDRAGIKYEAMEDGSYRIGLRLEGDRTQLAIIRPEVRKIGKTEIIDVVSFAYMEKSPLNAERLNQLLEDNVSYPLGSWGATKLEDGRYSRAVGE